MKIIVVVVVVVVNECLNFTAYGREDVLFDVFSGQV